MSYKVDTTKNFEREAKKFIKKYKSLKGEKDDISDKEIQNLIFDKN